MTVKELTRKLEEDFPLSLAYDWDNVGLQVGKMDQEIEQILLTLDVTLEVINEAIMIGANMIIAHHPMIFRPIKQILTDQVSGQMIDLLLKHDIALYVMHTNYDISKEGMNHALANKLDLTNQEVIEFTTEEEGLGRIGEITETTFENVIKKVKRALNVDDIRVIGGLHQQVKKVAIVGGSGSSVINQAIDLGADLLITGDISYHSALDMKNAGLLGLDPGHHIEVIFVDELAKRLADAFEEPMVVKSKVNTNPMKTL